MAAVPVADPSHHRAQRVLLSDELPSNIHKRGDTVERVQLHHVSPGHAVARTTPGNTQSRF
jgi:glutathione transport system ATP-binding protein